MESIIDKIFDWEASYEGFKATKKFDELSKQLCSVYEKLIELLDDDRKVLLESLLDLESQMAAEMDTEHFKEGFKLGLQIGVEVFKK